MNLIPLISFLVLYTNCNRPIQDYIKVYQLETKKSVILKLSHADSTILGVNLVKVVKLYNQSMFDKSIVKIDYNYSEKLSNWRNLGFNIFEKNKMGVTAISSTGKKNIAGKKYFNFIFYTRHFVDSSKQTQQQFKPYIDKMLSENKDTLHIGTVAEFKSRHGKLFEKLTQNDSISIQFLEGDALGERITVPVNW